MIIHLRSFFAPQLDDSVLNWQPSGIEPQMGDASVQARMESILGQNAVVVPKELEEKLKNNPQLAREMMQKSSICLCSKASCRRPTHRL